MNELMSLPLLVIHPHLRLCRERLAPEDWQFDSAFLVNNLLHLHV
jgi:hypothetical protein